MTSAMNQDTRIPELLHVMEKLVSIHRNLIDLLQEEYGHMVNVDVKGLTEAAQTKEILVHEIWSHEQLRLKCVRSICSDLQIENSSGTPETLFEISKKIPVEDKKKLDALKQVLLLLIARAKEANAKNVRFVEQSLTRIETMKKNILGLGNNTKENYSNSGMRNPITEQGGRLLATEA